MRWGSSWAWHLDELMFGWDYILVERLGVMSACMRWVPKLSWVFGWDGITCCAHLFRLLVCWKSFKSTVVRPFVLVINWAGEVSSVEERKTVPLDTLVPWSCIALYNLFLSIRRTIALPHDLISLQVLQTSFHTMSALPLLVPCCFCALILNR